MKPDKFDILMEIVKQEAFRSLGSSKPVYIDHNVLFMYMERASYVHDNYDESKTLLQNLEYETSNISNK